jgi:hypothetical protein
VRLSSPFLSLSLYPCSSHLPALGGLLARLLFS